MRSACLAPDAPAPQISEGLQVLPGVEALLVALAARANCVTGLVRRTCAVFAFACLRALRR